MNELSQTDIKRRDVRTMVLIKDLLEYAFPHTTNTPEYREDVDIFALGLSKFIAHAKDWNPGVEELGVNLLCKFGNSAFQSIPEYRGPITKQGVLETIDTIVGRPIQKQLLGSQARKNLFALSEHIQKHETELGKTFAMRISNKLFSLAGNIEGAEHSY